MNVSWSQVGSVVGCAGLVLAVIAAAARLAGHFHLAGFEAMTLFQASIALLVAACFFKLIALEHHR
jgi:hypothetical protein